MYWIKPILLCSIFCYCHGLGSNTDLSMDSKSEVQAEIELGPNHDVRVRRQASGKETVIVTSILASPFLMMTKDGGFEGFIPDLMKKIAYLLDLDYKISLVKDGKYGAHHANGTWSGMIGELTRKEADIAAANLVITSIATRVVDFTKPFMQVSTVMVGKKPHKRASQSLKYIMFRPFSLEVWCLFIVAFLVMVIVLNLSVYFSPRSPVEGDSDKSILNSINYSCWHLLGILTLQGPSQYIQVPAVRILLIFWKFFCLVLITFYIAGLVSLLATETKPKRMILPINSVDDLVKQTEVKPGVVTDSYESQFFAMSKVAVYERLHNMIVPMEHSVVEGTIGSGIQRVRTSHGRYVLFTDSSSADYYINRKPCDLLKIGGNLNSLGLGLATPINSPLRDRLNLVILELQEKGVLAQLYSKWWYEQGQCQLEKDDKSRGRVMYQADVQMLAGPFAFLIIGLLISLIVKMVTIVLQRRSSKKEDAEIQM